MSSSSKAQAHWDRMYDDSIVSAWTQSPAVARELYIRMTGKPGYWLEWVFTDGMPGVDRMLSIGCGDGSHELAIARRGFARHVTAFDGSPLGIGRAAAIAEEEGLPIDFSVKLFETFVADPGPDDSYDCVMFCGSLHHVLDLEGMLGAVRKVLKPGGYLIVNEYVGPCYQLYPQSQVAIVNRFLERIPTEFRLGPDVVLELPTIEMIMEADPSEGVRSALIPTLVPMYFDPEHVRMAGGALLHPIFGMLNGTKVIDGSLESTALVEMLIACENELTAAGALQHDFLFGIYRNR
jgi:SAM-dependent methyltransferase